MANGFMDLSAVASQVAPKMVRNANGQMQVIYIDPKTGQQVNNLSGHQVTSVAPDLEQWGLDLSNHQPYTDDTNLIPNVNFSGAQYAPPDTPEQKPIENPQQELAPLANPAKGERPDSPSSSVGDSRSQGNNFGYFDKPGWMGALGALPGGLGLAGKGVNAVANMNNVSAVNAARDAMDVKELSDREAFGGAVKDRQGFVGNVDITNAAGATNPYSVGLEAETPSGKTTLTPDEARARAQANPANISLSADQKENKKSPLSGIKASIKTFMDDLFSDEDDKDKFPNAPNQPTQQPSKGFKSFTDKSGNTPQKSYDGTSYAGTNQGLDTPSETSGFGRFGNSSGLSDSAKGDVDKGKGGLY